MEIDCLLSKTDFCLFVLFLNVFEVLKENLSSILKYRFLLCWLNFFSLHCPMIIQKSFKYTDLVLKNSCAAETMNREQFFPRIKKV